jgi:hypothetical protein
MAAPEGNGGALILVLHDSTVPGRFHRRTGAPGQRWRMLRRAIEIN